MTWIKLNLIFFFFKFIIWPYNVDDGSWISCSYDDDIIDDCTRFLACQVITSCNRVTYWPTFNTKSWPAVHHQANVDAPFHLFNKNIWKLPLKEKKKSWHCQQLDMRNMCIADVQLHRQSDSFSGIGLAIIANA